MAKNRHLGSSQLLEMHIMVLRHPGRTFSSLAESFTIEDFITSHLKNSRSRGPFLTKELGIHHPAVLEAMLTKRLSPGL